MIAELVRSLDSMNWPATEGVIVDHSEYDVGTGNRRVTYVKLAYTYRVGDENYRGERFSFAGDPTKVLGSLYNEGNAVDVHFDPDQPREAILFHRYRWLESFLAAMSLMIGLLATFIFGGNAWFPHLANDDS